MTEKEKSSMQCSLVRFQGETIIETTANEPSGPGGIARSDAPSTGEVLEMPHISPVPSRPSGSSFRSEDKGKAPLEERDEEDGDEDEDEIPLQRKHRASAPPTLNTYPGLAPEGVGSKRAKVESSPDTEEAPLVGLEDMPQVCLVSI
ncbi:hypothetical protein L3X38_017227 [Prunus dulcis]|uniref:Uncharacterized protein n=1 Tax=Prunus dulcis TaxID=3755 RepID=A0AAD4Z9U8_PRUDU|nr:hypothetical protein L3X38_017227 [Prunus dulcis]